MNVNVNVNVNVNLSREVLGATEMDDGLLRLLDRMDRPEEEGVRARRAYVALRMIRTRFSRAPETVQEFNIRLSEQAARALANETSTLPTHLQLSEILEQRLTEKQEEQDEQHDTSRPWDRPTTRTSRGYGFRR